MFLMQMLSELLFAGPINHCISMTEPISHGTGQKLPFQTERCGRAPCEQSQPGSHLLHSDKELPAGLCSKIDPQHSPLRKFNLPTATPKRVAKSRCRLLLKLRIQFHFHITKDTNMPDINTTLHHVRAPSAGASSMDHVSPTSNRQRLGKQHKSNQHKKSTFLK